MFISIMCQNIKKVTRNFCFRITEKKNNASNKVPYHSNNLFLGGLLKKKKSEKYFT